jgi:hypothetical protein
MRSFSSQVQDLLRATARNPDPPSLATVLTSNCKFMTGLNPFMRQRDVVIRIVIASSSRLQPTAYAIANRIYSPTFAERLLEESALTGRAKGRAAAVKHDRSVLLVVTAAVIIFQLQKNEVKPLKSLPRAQNRTPRRNVQF